MSLLKRLEQAQLPVEQSSKLEELRTKRQPMASSRDDTIDIKSRIQEKLIAGLDPNLDVVARADEVKETIRELFHSFLNEENIVLSRIDRTALFDQIISEILGYGPIERLLKDSTITEIMCNGPKDVYVERRGKITRTDITFDDDEHLSRIIDRIVAPLGRRVDESSPMVDARLPDGSRVNAIIPPISLNGPVLTIRLFAQTPFQVDDLIGFGTITPEAVTFLDACVRARLNIVISGGTGSGKTTFLNVLSGFIPDDDRIITIENAAELQLRQEHVVTLEARPPNIEGKGAIEIRDLVVNSLRMRPDRIVVGEVRAGEALDMLQAMNTGHDGSLTTAHSNSPRDTLARLETMCLMAGMDLPLRAIREQIASALDLIVHEERLRDGTRKIVAITEVQGMEGDIITLSDIFAFEQTGIEEGRVIGRLKPTGIRPKFTERMEAENIKLPPDIFGASIHLR